ncbi:MAG: hypothetical protein ABWZ26_08260 [Candidatus Nanopelagicales bacterium]
MAREKVGRVPSIARSEVSRRKLLVGLLGAPALGLLAACTNGNDGVPSPTATPEPDVDPAVIAAALARERNLISLYAAAPAEAAPALQPFVDRHRAHAAVLEQAAGGGATVGSSPAAPSAGLPPDLPAARAALALAETAAADAGIAALAPVSAQLARTLAAIASCESAHAALLRSA